MRLRLLSACRLALLVGTWLTVLSDTGRAQNKCQLKSPSGRIKHVIYVQFDNTHFLRDNPNVPSDLEQMPHLLNFIKDNGTLLANDHTVLISHTATGILTSLRRLSGPHGPAGVEQLPLLQDRRHDPDRRLVCLLDGAPV